jgi:hypothetical protein
MFLRVRGVRWEGGKKIKDREEFSMQMYKRERMALQVTNSKFLYMHFFKLLGVAKSQDLPS